MAQVIGNMPVKDTSIFNLSVNDHSIECEEILGRYIKARMGNLARGLEHESSETGFNRSFLVNFVIEYFFDWVTHHDFAPEEVEQASRMYREMVYVERSFKMSSVRLSDETRDRLMELWFYFDDYRARFDIEIPNLQAPRGDGRNLRMIVWMLMALAARMAARDEITFQL